MNDWNLFLSAAYYEGGWSTGYTAFSILMQLQAFLFDEHVPQFNTDSKDKIKSNKMALDQRKRAIDEAQKFVCKECGYNLKFKAVDEQEIRMGKFLLSSYFFFLLLSSSFLMLFCPYCKFSD